MKRAHNPRVTAVRVLRRVMVDGQTLKLATRASDLDCMDARDAAFTKELCFGVLRQLPRLEAVLERLLDRPLRTRDQDLHILLLTGLYQLEHMKVPAYAAVVETVAAASTIGKPWAKGLMNGVLREFARQPETYLGAADWNINVALAHPPWLVEAIRECWPDDWQRILVANNEHPPMTLRVNRSRIDPGDYLERLAQAGMSARAALHAPAGITLARPVDVAQLPGFAEGLISLQDAAAQQAAPLLAPQEGERVLDACAAPGGKTAHVLEWQPRVGELIALDRDRARVALTKDGLDRLGLNATLLCDDAGQPQRWRDSRPFDRVLLDAPCSATGIIRRQPDVKLLRKPPQLPRLVQEQSRLLDALWPLLAPGGTLVYATCSVLKEENEVQVARFIETHLDAKICPIEASWGRSRPGGRQIFPGEHDMDGFFFARIKKG